MSTDNIKCKYIFKDDYNPLFANGAYGGVNPLGEIIIHFFLERNALPNSQTFSNKNGFLDTKSIEEVEPLDLQKSFVRFIQTGVVLNYKTAKEIHKWLGDHLTILETNTKKDEK